MMAPTEIITFKKQALRQRMHQLLRALPAKYRADASQRIAGQVLSRMENSDNTTTGLFLSRHDEVDTGPLLETWKSQGRPLAIPAWDQTEKAYRWAKLPASNELVLDPFGILHPANPTWLPAQILATILVPGLAFDPQGWRLGRGGGHFDQLLLGTSGMRIGLGFVFQCVDEVPRNPWDIPLNLFVHDKATLGPWPTPQIDMRLPKKPERKLG